MAKHSIPLFAALQSYSPSMLSADIIAGLTVGIILIPQALAYGLLAGVPPIYGLYSALIPMIIYAFFGSSSFLSIYIRGLEDFMTLARHGIDLSKTTKGHRDG